MRQRVHKHHVKTFFLGLLLSSLLIAGCQNQSESRYSESAHEALSTFTIEPGFKIELVASEPMIVDPVAMEIDENGLMYVVEMPGYPLDLSGSGRIKLLEDTDGDGHMDKSTVYADGLLLPTGVMRWKQGLLVTDPPNLLYLEDSDLDGKADVKDTVLTGFAVSNPSHIVNHPLFGLDNWIYIANDPAVSTVVYAKEFGDRGKEITFAGKMDGPRLPQNANGRSLRLQPDKSLLELQASKTQFGHSFDAWGHLFTVNNSNHAMHEVIAARYLNRNPDLLVTEATQSLSDHGNASEIFPTTKNPELQMLTNVGVITSACAITSYQGGAFPEEYNTNINFVAEPVSNLLHVDRIKDHGASFVASRIHEKKEFLTSTDAWFRPVYLYIGPDGALYAVDYYRRIIEHPEYMSDEVNQSGKLYDGRDKGRIYRISSADGSPMTWPGKLKLSDYSNIELIEKLADKNIWWRKNAQRLLLDRGTEQDVPALLEMANNLNSALGRLHALWTLEGLGYLASTQIRKALNDKEAGVRKNAIILAELHLPSDPALANDLLPMKGDPDSKVRFQLLCTLGFIPGVEADKARQELLFSKIEDPWMQIGALSAASSHKSGLLDAVLQKFEKNRPEYASLVQRISSMVGASEESGPIRNLIFRAGNTKLDQGWEGPVLEGLAQGLKTKRSAPDSYKEERQILVKNFFSNKSEALRQGSLHTLQAIGMPDGTQTQSALEKARQIAGSKNNSAKERSTAIEFLTLKNPSPYTAFLKQLIVTGEDLPVQTAAFKALSAIPDATVSQFILERWESLTPELRDVALNTFLINPDRVAILLDAIERNKISKSSVGFNRSVRLMVHADVPLRTRARNLFTKNDSKRKDVIESYNASLDMVGSAENGKVIFAKNCSSCHQIRGNSGTAYGPDLGTVHNWPPPDLLVNILDPDRSISDGFDVWEVTLNNNEMAQGIISSETPNALTLRNAGGQELVIARTDIKSIRGLGMSSMPSGLEAQIDVKQMSDLLAYLKQVD